MKLYLIEYVEPRTQTIMSVKLLGADKTDVRDRFFELYPHVEHVDRISWVPVNPSNGKPA